MTEASENRWGYDVLCMFDAPDCDRDFLADVLESCRLPQEVSRMRDLSLLAGAEDWSSLIECANSIGRACCSDSTSLEGQDMLTHVWHALHATAQDRVVLPPEQSGWEETDLMIARAKGLEENGQDQLLLEGSPSLQPWAQTDSLIARAQELMRDAKSLFTSNGITRHQELRRPTTRPSATESTTSPYWDIQSQLQRPNQSFDWTKTARNPQSQPREVSSTPASSEPTPVPQWETYQQDLGFANSTASAELAIGTKQATISPYFLQSALGKKSPRKRPPPGTVSTVPFARLTSPTFGVIQEEFAHDPFWLLVAVTFLIRTNGKLAIPMFYAVKKRFPTPAHIANCNNTQPLIDMIRHLGLSVVRVAFMQKYARGFLEDPPRAHVRYKVKGYDRRDIDPTLRPSQEMGVTGDIDENAALTINGDGDDLEAWEIGHLTKGKYAIDSWRIFCRDELLGRAEDWNGKGREPEFQPEWMRVMPEDKELRAYLRWMWMREGWEWNPITGERTVLRDEMRRAVNEGRVEYDDTGGLRILDEPRQ